MGILPMIHGLEARATLQRLLPFAALEVRMEALARLNRKAEAKAAAQTLFEKGLRHPGFLKRCREQGIDLAG